jgi:hypothetical protein
MVLALSAITFHSVIKQYLLKELLHLSFYNSNFVMSAYLGTPESKSPSCQIGIYQLSILSRFNLSIAFYFTTLLFLASTPSLFVLANFFFFQIGPHIFAQASLEI